MAKVNTVTCTTGSGNTGVGDCPVHMKFEGLIAVPSTATFTEAQLSDLVAHVTSKTKEVLSADRFYPFPEFIGGEVTGGDGNRVDFDNGSSVITWENDYLMTGKFYNPGIILNNALRTRNGADIYFIGFGGGKAYGSYSNGTYKGFKGKNFWAMAQVPGAFKIESKYSFSFNVDVKELNENYWYVDAQGIESVKGLRSIEPKVSTALNAAGLIVLSLLEKGYGFDYGANYETALNGLPWTAKNVATGASITVSTSTMVNGKLNIDLDSADTDYPAVGGKIEFKGPSISALEGAGIAGVV